MEKKIGNINVDTTNYETYLTKKYLMRKPYQKDDPKKLYAFIPGVIREIYIKKGSRVKTGDPLFVLEAMKMRNTVLAHFDTRIHQIYISTEQKVSKGELVIEFE